MIDFQKFAVHTEHLRDAVRDAVEGGSEIREKVRLATLRALAGKPLELQEIHAALHAAVKGAALAGGADHMPLRRALSEAVAGLDDALTSAAHALQLAGEESVGAAQAWHAGELRRLVDELRSLEALFVESLDGAARGAGNSAGDILSSLAGHARFHGTRAGRAAFDAVARLEGPLRAATERELRGGGAVARATGAGIASVASGILAGIADALAPPPGRDAAPPPGR